MSGPEVTPDPQALHEDAAARLAAAISADMTVSDEHAARLIAGILPYDGIAGEIGNSAPTVVSEQTAVAELAHRRVGARRLFLGATAGLALLAACTNGAPDTRPSTPSAVVRLDLDLGATKLITAAQVIPETDQSLAEAGNNCGHTLSAETAKRFEQKFDYSTQIDFLNRNPDTAQNLIDFQINNPTWGMGEEAWQVVLNRAIVNPGTPEDHVVTDNVDSNEYAHRIFTVETAKDHELLNFTCTDANGNVTQVHAASLARIKTTNLLSGPIFTTSGKDAFVNAAPKDVNGKSIFEILDLGDHKVFDANGNEVLTTLYMVVTEAKGCENPERAIPATVTETTSSAPATTAQEEATTTTKKPATTSSSSSSSSSSVPASTSTSSSTTSTSTTSTTAPPRTTTTNSSTTSSSVTSTTLAPTTTVGPTTSTTNRGKQVTDSPVVADPNALIEVIRPNVPVEPTRPTVVTTTIANRGDSGSGAVNTVATVASTIPRVTVTSQQVVQGTVAPR